VMACQQARRAKSFGHAPVAWQAPPTQAVEIGKSSLNVSLWQVDHPQWSDRFKRTAVKLVAQDGPAKLACTYDVTTSVAELRQI
jgi:hypothetical protein